MRMPSRRTMGKSMVAIGVVSLIVSLVAVFVGQSVISQVESSVDDSLVLTNQALEVAGDSIQTVSTIVTTVRSGVSSISITLDALNTSVADTTTAISASTDFLGTSLPEALDAVGNVLPTIESAAHSVDSALRIISKAPFGPDYNPAQPFDQAIGDLTRALGPIPDELRSLAGQFNGLTASSAKVSNQLTVLSGDVRRLDQQLAQVSTLVDRFGKTAANAQIVTAVSRNNLQSSARSARILLILLGLMFAVSQVVPIWIGKDLQRDTEREEADVPGVGVVTDSPSS